MPATTDIEGLKKGLNGLNSDTQLALATVNVLDAQLPPENAEIGSFDRRTKKLTEEVKNLASKTQSLVAQLVQKTLELNEATQLSVTVGYSESRSFRLSEQQNGTSHNLRSGDVSTMASTAVKSDQVKKHCVELTSHIQSDDQDADAFSRLSDELVLLIFKQLPEHILRDIATVNKRWQRISSDSTLWDEPSLDHYEGVMPNSLHYLLSRGTKYISLTDNTNLLEPVFEYGILEMSYRLQSLYVNDLEISRKGLATLLDRCPHLRNLRLACDKVNDPACEAIGRMSQLQLLNLSLSYGLDKENFAFITAGCTELLELNISTTSLKDNALPMLCRTLGRKLRRLDLEGMWCLKDGDLVALVKRCPQLTELNLYGCTGLTDASYLVLFSLTKLKVLGLRNNYPSSVDIHWLAALPALTYYLYVCDAEVPEDFREALLKAIPNIVIDARLMSEIATNY